MKNTPGSDILRRWFAGLVETSFQTEVGLCEPGLLDYMVDLLTDFIHVERIAQIDDGSGRKVDDLAQMLSAAETDITLGADERRRKIHRHIGDYTLFWTGVYPERLKFMHRRKTRDDLISYFEQGKRSYEIASRLSSNDTRPPASILQLLSKEFEICVYGLGLVRKHWEHGASGTAQLLP
jgi:hypothetical protein